MTEDRETLQKEAEAIKHRIESTRREAEQVAEHYNGQLKSLYEDLKVRDDALEALDGGKPTQMSWNVLPDRPLRIQVEWAVDEGYKVAGVNLKEAFERAIKATDDFNKAYSHFADLKRPHCTTKCPSCGTWNEQRGEFPERIPCFRCGYSLPGNPE